MVEEELAIEMQSAVFCIQYRKLVLIKECRKCKHLKRVLRLSTEKDFDLTGIVRCSFVHDVAMKELAHNG